MTDLIPLKDIERLKKAYDDLEELTHARACEIRSARISSIFMRSMLGALPSLLAAAECAHRQREEIERWKCAVREVMASRNPMDEDDANRHLYASGWEDACRVILRRVNEPQAQQEPQV